MPRTRHAFHAWMRPPLPESRSFGGNRRVSCPRSFIPTVTGGLGPRAFALVTTHIIATYAKACVGDSNGDDCDKTSSNQGWLARWRPVLLACEAICSSEFAADFGYSDSLQPGYGQLFHQLRRRPLHHRQSLHPQRTQLAEFQVGADLDGSRRFLASADVAVSRARYSAFSSQSRRSSFC